MDHFELHSEYQPDGRLSTLRFLHAEYWNHDRTGCILSPNRMHSLL